MAAVDDAATTSSKELEVHSTAEEVLPATLWSSDTRHVIPKSQNGCEIHGRWYILQMLVHDQPETIVAELSQWSRNSDCSTEFLRNWNPKLTFGTTEERSNQNPYYYLILKNVSNFNTRGGLFNLLGRLWDQERISLTYGWIKWLTGNKNNYQLRMSTLSLKTLLMNTIKEQNMALVRPMKEPWQENQATLLLDEVLYTATDEEFPVLPSQKRKRTAPWEELTQSAPGPKQPAMARDADANETQTQEMQRGTTQLPITTNEPAQSGSTRLEKTCQGGVGEDLSERVNCSSCDCQLPSNFNYCNMCGVALNALNTKDEPPLLLTPPATASGRSVSQYPILTPPASPAKGRATNHDTLLTPHTSTPTLPASVQASTSSQNYAQTLQLSQGASQSSQHSTFRTPISQVGENGSQTTRQSQFSDQVTQSRQNSQFCTNVSQPRHNHTQSSQSSQQLQPDQLHVLQSIKDEVQFCQAHQGDDQMPQTDQGSTVHNSASLTCSGAQHNAVNADINAQNADINAQNADINAQNADINTRVDSSEEEKLLRNLQQRHYTDTGLHVAFPVTSSNPLTVQCSVCHETVQTGSLEQKFPDLQRHLSDTTHNVNLSKLEKKDAVKAIYEWIKETYPDQFILKQDLAVCRFDQHKINLLPTGNPYRWLFTHVNSKGHKTSKKNKGNSPDISKYLLLSKKI
nr:uncharacterized protein LOC123775037 [Procambarus clarkii]